MGLVQLFVEIKNSPDDDFFTDPTGLETTTPLPLYFADGDDDDEDEEEDGGSDEDEGDEEEEYWNGDLGGWGYYRWGNRYEEGEDDEDEDEGEHAHRPYRFTADPTLYIDNRRVAALGQNAAYAEILMTRQFRTCVFSLSVSGRFVRFLRWDREGVVVSQAVDYKANPMPLATFLWAFASASNSERGWDTSAQPSCDATHEKLFCDRITEHVMDQLNMQRDDPDLINKVNEHYQEKVITRLLVPSAEREGELVQVLVSRPCFTSRSPTGRSTRGYWGVVVKENMQESEVVFLKDVWRSNVEGVEREGDVLHRLHEKGVRNIPPLVAHSDIEDDGEPPCELFVFSLTKVDVGIVQVTDTDKLVRKRWVASLTTKERRNLGMSSRVHYRLVTRRAGYPLETFSGSKELLEGTHGAYLGGIKCLFTDFH